MIRFFKHKLDELRWFTVFKNVFTGLIPAGKDTNDAWIRDNVYAAIAIWGVDLAYRKLPDDDADKSRSYQLEKLVVKLMRGILQCYMMQSSKVEAFKHTQDKKDSLHAKFDARTCQPVVGDAEWGHLQIDAVSLFLLTLAQMTESGIRIIWSTEEVSFVQNLVFYIELAYRIPDYGIWERGDKTNHGLPELNTSSVGMAKAALKAMSDLDMFGANNSALASIHVLPDEWQQCSTVLENMLPRESNSKEIDSSLLGIISFPAFAVDDENLVNHTRNTILEKLLGSYGCKRFLRDGFRTALEDANRLYYEPWELRRFQGIECEWPMFFCYLAIDAIFNKENEFAAKYLDQIEQIVIRNINMGRKTSVTSCKKLSYSGSPSPSHSEAFPLMPESFTVSGKRIDAELAKPHSQQRDAVGRVPHIWGQSLYILANLLNDGIILPGEIDPLGRRMVTQPKPDLSVQVVILAENEQIKKHLSEFNLNVQTFSEAFSESEIRIYPAKVLSHLYKQLGFCKKLNLTGRVNKEIGILASSRFYRVANHTIAFTPQFIDHHAFYLSLDVDFILDSFRSSVQYLRRAWNDFGRPVLIIPVYEWFFRPVEGNKLPSLVSTIKKLRSGYINGTRTMLGTLKGFQETSCVTKLSFLNSDGLFNYCSLLLHFVKCHIHQLSHLAS
ncbi:Phosphorylase b kinase regulatory subunit alpha [Cichlidogyrus casuarinus]|uniref:Phosphorylase b kinase regulatory subunit n=1 Tax=Cichlidogyrus casuarinus TaxID=1844966 RepID=A0ABD2PYP7_9PLAT